MSKIDDVKRFTNSWVNSKKDIISNTTNKSSLLSILQASKPGSSKSKFKERGSISKNENDGRDVIVPGFKINISLNEQEAKTLLRSLSLSKNNLPFGYVASKEYVDGKPTVSIETKGDYTGSLMKNPRYVGAVNIKAYAEYAVFRGIVNSIAATSMYQFDKNKAPAVIESEHPGMKNINDFLLLTSRCYVPADEDIDNLLNETLTKNDNDKILNTFSSSLSKPAQVRDIREKITLEMTELKRNMDAGGAPADDEPEVQPRRRFG